MTFGFGFKMQPADNFFLIFTIAIIADLGCELIDNRRLWELTALVLQMNIGLVVQDRFNLVHVALLMNLVVFCRRQN